jgi:hypothetical protein
VLWRSNKGGNGTDNLDPWVEKQNFPPSLYGNGRVNPSQNLVDAFPMADGTPITESADWNLRYRDALNSLKMRLDDHIYGLGRLAVELHQMLLDGYSTSDFARRHRLTEQQMNRLLTMIRKEADSSIIQAA